MRIGGKHPYGMSQTGGIGSQQIHAWAFGSLAGYTWSLIPGRLASDYSFDGASGDHNPHDHDLNTFNPLFPNGYYMTLSGYTGYVNFIHMKPSVTLHPTRTLNVLLAATAQWRQSTAGAIYTQPDIPIAGTAGHPGGYTRSYGAGSAGLDGNTERGVCG
jgi:hypothetical protein